MSINSKSIIPIFQIRIEDDQSHSKAKQNEIGENEVLLIDEQFEGLHSKFSGKNIFFTTGQNHQYIKNKFEFNNNNAE